MQAAAQFAGLLKGKVAILCQLDCSRINADDAGKRDVKTPDSVQIKGNQVLGSHLLFEQRLVIRGDGQFQHAPIVS